MLELFIRSTPDNLIYEPAKRGLQISLAIGLQALVTHDRISEIAELLGRDLAHDGIELLQERIEKLSAETGLEGGPPLL